MAEKRTHDDAHTHTAPSAEPVTHGGGPHGDNRAGNHALGQAAVARMAGEDNATGHSHAEAGNAGEIAADTTEKIEPVVKAVIGLLGAAEKLGNPVDILVHIVKYGPYLVGQHGAAKVADALTKVFARFGALTDKLGGAGPALAAVKTAFEAVEAANSIIHLLGVFANPNHTLAQACDAVKGVASACGPQVLKGLVAAQVMATTGNAEAAEKSGELAEAITKYGIVAVDKASMVALTAYFRWYFNPGEMGDPGSAKQQFNTFGALAIDEYNATMMFRIQLKLGNPDAGRFDSWKHEMWKYHHFTQ